MSDIDPQDAAENASEVADPEQVAGQKPLHEHDRVPRILLTGIIVVAALLIGDGTRHLVVNL